MQNGEDNSASPAVTPPMTLQPILVDLRPAPIGEPTQADSPRQPSASRPAHSWEGLTFILISIGIALIACCLLIPEMDDNRQLQSECDNLKLDLDHLKRQIDVNEQFITSIGRDPGLAERLAQRQLNFIRKGTRVLKLNEGSSTAVRSPFALVNIAPPDSQPFQQSPSRLAAACRDAHTRLFLLGGGLMLLAIGLILGNGANAPR